MLQAHFQDDSDHDDDTNMDVNDMMTKERELHRDLFPQILNSSKVSLSLSSG